MSKAVKLLFLGWLLILASGALAQSVATADLHGTVRDPNGALVTNAKVTVRDEARNFERFVSTDPQGEFRFLLLPPRTYTVTIEAPSFAKATRQVTLTVGQAAELPIEMGISAATETVNVTSEAPIIETTRTSVTTTVDQMRIDNLPINGRNYVNFTLVNSQVARDAAPNIGAAQTSGLNVGGQRARSNLVNVDGEDMTDNSTNGVRSTVSQEAVQEFQLITNSYAPEYGRASGGVVNIVTRGGTNQLHGTMFGYLRNRHIQAVNPFSTVTDPAYTRVQTGATLSGPIKKDKTFFFLSFETTRRHETGFSSIGANNFGFVPLTLPGLGTFQVTPAQAQYLGTNAAILANPADPRYPIVSGYLFTTAASSAVALNRVQPAAFGGRAGFASTCTPLTPVCAPLPASYVGLSTVTGNFPLFEGTTLYSARLDHRLSNNHQLLVRGSASPSTVTGIQVNAQGPTQNFGQNAFSRTSEQTYRDASVTAQETWTIGANKLNEFRFQYARRGLLYNFSSSPGGSNVAVNIGGFAFIGREPFSFVRRTEQRYQFTDNFSWSTGNHNMKFGADVNLLPVKADFTVNFGGVYDFGGIDATSINPAFGMPVGGLTAPRFSPVQAYGLGIPSSFIQGIGNPHDEFTNKTVGGFIQDSWRIKPNFTVNYGARYDVEFTPQFTAPTALAAAAEKAIGVTEGIPRDYNNIAPRVGFAWDPLKDGKTVVRGSYGMFYDHPLLAIVFLSHVANGSGTPTFALFPGSPQPCNVATAGLSGLNATNVFQGLLGCLPASFGYLPNEQRFNAFQPNSILVNENFLAAGIPLGILPFGFMTGRNFEYAYSEQASFGIERDLGHNFAIGVTYNYNGGHHLNRPRDANPPLLGPLVANWRAMLADPTLPAAVKAAYATDPRAVGSNPAYAAGVGARGPWVSAAVMNFFRRSGVNPALCGTTNGLNCPAQPAQLQALIAAIEQQYGITCLLYTSPSPRDLSTSRMPTSA